MSACKCCCSHVLANNVVGLGLSVVTTPSTALQCLQLLFFLRYVPSSCLKILGIGEAWLDEARLQAVERARHDTRQGHEAADAFEAARIQLVGATIGALLRAPSHIVVPDQANHG